MSAEANCRSCGARVLWVRTQNNKQMPIDVNPVPDGNVVMLQASTFLDDTYYRRVVVLKADATVEEGIDRYVSHFSTCPNAKHWRKR